MENKRPLRVGDKVIISIREIDAGNVAFEGFDENRVYTVGSVYGENFSSPEFTLSDFRDNGIAFYEDEVVKNLTAEEEQFVMDCPDSHELDDFISGFIMEDV